jgi:hypothetical protein
MLFNNVVQGLINVKKSKDSTYPQYLVSLRCQLHLIILKMVCLNFNPFQNHFTPFNFLYTKGISYFFNCLAGAYCCMEIVSQWILFLLFRLSDVKCSQAEFSTFGNFLKSMGYEQQ